MIVDSHVNLHGEKFADDLEDAIIRAREAGIGPMLNICCHLNDFDDVLKVAHTDPNIWATVGTHPHDAKDNPDITAQDIISLTQDHKVVGIGETGLDYHYDWSPREVQKANFQAHIDAVHETGLPLVVHTREADEDMMQMLQSAYAAKPFNAIMHCYTSGQRLADAAAEMGFYFSVSGIMTFKNAHDVRERIKSMPQDRIMLETDCPYLDLAVDLPAEFRVLAEIGAFAIPMNQKMHAREALFCFKNGKGLVNPTRIHARIF